MITKDLLAYAQSNWEELRASVTELSWDPRSHKSLVEHDKLLYGFDKICDNLFARQIKKKPTSADAVDITEREIQVVEFKSGFQPKITRENFDEERACCQKTKQVCKEYWDLFFKNQKTERDELFQSMRAKAIESCVILERQVFPGCEDRSKAMPMVFVAVIDGDPIEAMEDTLADLGSLHNKEEVKTNQFDSLRQALTRLAGIRGTDGEIYFYDRVEVLSAKEYTARLTVE